MLVAAAAGAALIGPGAEGQVTKAAPPLAGLPAGVAASVFAFDPLQPNIVYVASVDARGGVYVYKTTGNGRHWHPTAARGKGWISDILSLTADPRHPGTLYAGTDTAVYVTVDGGRTWRPFNRGLFPPPGAKVPFGMPGTPTWNRNGGWILNIAVDPVDSNIVYSAADAVRKSTDGGRTWKTVLLPHPDQKRYPVVSRIAIAAGRVESIYAITHDLAGRTTIYKSNDGGTRWRATGNRTSALPKSCCWDSTDALAVDRQTPGTVYAALGGTVIKTTDGGISWQRITHGLPKGSVTSLATDPERSGTLYAAVATTRQRGGIYTSTDGGRSWTRALTGAAIRSLAVDLARPTTIYAASADWRTQTFRMYRSTDRGRTWAIAGG